MAMGNGTMIMVMADYSQMRNLGRLIVTSCMLTGDHRVRYLMCKPYCTLDR